ncbi:hypothetical protein SORBI_3002G284600 [Sorghum bicolor]|uniref:Uncharacterized protein n=1 Tax=Sorghum bicolor TaxID=4558 RepID=A0A1W0W685_SORBI|nr:hypothetical protein SORBI_3002G284600 [Sorghum bicolor]
MISSKRLVQLAKKWQHMAALGRRRLTMITTIKDGNLYCTSAIANKGHCVVYTADDRITVPCEAEVMEYVMCLLRRKPSQEVERAVLSSVLMPCNCMSSMFMVSKGLDQSLSIF